MHPIVSLVVGLAFAGFGGELFVRGAVGVAQWARVPAGVIAATVAAFATSSPELSVSVSAALAGAPQIAFGDALGSNVVNIGLVLGVALLFGALAGTDQSLRRDLPTALFAPVLTALLVLDGEVSRLDAAVLLAVFAAWLVLTALAARKARSAVVKAVGGVRYGRAVLETVLGLVLLVAAGRLVVDGAKYIGEVLGWSPFVVGATLVALGTSMPELATTAVSRLRGHDEVGLGTVLGSNVFNNLFIVGVAGSITPIVVAPATALVGLAGGVAMLLLVLPGRGGSIPRWRAWPLLAAYAAFVVVQIMT
jgi:cation:H+ antiporter